MKRLILLSLAFIGAIISAILFGYAISIFLVKRKIALSLSVVLSQIVIVLLRIWGAEEKGTWTIDPILYVTTSLIAFLVIPKLMKRRESKEKNSNS